MHGSQIKALNIPVFTLEFEFIEATNRCTSSPAFFRGSSREAAEKCPGAVHGCWQMSRLVLSLDCQIKELKTLPLSDPNWRDAEEVERMI